MLCQDKNLEHNICAPLTIICCVNLVFIESTVNLFKQFNVIYFIIKASVSKLMKKTEPSLCCLVHTLVPEVFIDIFLRKREREGERQQQRKFSRKPSGTRVFSSQPLPNLLSIVFTGKSSLKCQLFVPQKSGLGQGEVY